MKVHVKWRPCSPARSSMLSNPIRSIDSVATMLSVLLMNSCTVQENLHPDVHGHRGSSGTHPENTIPAFLHAIEKGCDFIEMDVVLTADQQVVISHEPWIEPSLCLDQDGGTISA